MSSSCSFRCFARVSASSSSSVWASLSAASSCRERVRSLYAVWSLLRRPSAFWSRFLKDEGEKGSTSPLGKRADRMSSVRMSSERSAGI